MIIENCGSPVTGVNPFTGSEEFTLPPGTYNFKVAAFIVINEEEIESTIRDLDPESITWTIEEEEPIVVETTLEAEDGNDDTITDEDSTTSNDIEFTFTGMTNSPDELTERGFECTLVEEPGGDPILISDNCGSPVTGVNPFTGSEEFTLPPGTYTFEVAAFIVINGEEIERTIRDLDPESITWTIEEETYCSRDYT